MTYPALAIEINTGIFVRAVQWLLLRNDVKIATVSDAGEYADIDGTGNFFDESFLKN